MAELDYTIPDEERRRNLWAALAMASGGLLGAQKGREAEAFGRAGQTFLGTHEALNRSWQDQQQERMRSQMMQMQMDAYRQQQADAAEQRRLQEGLGPLMAGMPTLGQGTAPPQAGVAPRTAAQFGPGGGDSLDATSMPPAPRTQAAAGPYEAFLAKAQYLEEQAQRNPRMAPQLMKLAEGYYAQAEKWRSKNYGSLQATRTPDGKPVMVQQQEYGAPQLTGYQPPPNMHAVPLGDRTEFVDTSGVSALPSLKAGQSPDSKARVGLDERKFAYEQGKDRLAQAPKPTWDSASKQWVMPPDAMAPGTAATPAGFVNPPVKPPIEYQKTITGITNLQSAIQEYVSALQEFSTLSQLNPAARAKLGTYYNNMMLQGKEAYNLGVLNGPDLSILQETITNPLSWSGVGVPKAAMEQQALALSKLMEKNAANTAQVHGQPAPGPGTAAVKPRTAPTVSDLEKELKRRGIAL